MRLLAKIFLTLGLGGFVFAMPQALWAQSTTPSNLREKQVYSKLTLSLSPGITLVKTKKIDSNTSQGPSPTPRLVKEFVGKTEEFLVLTDYLGSGRLYIPRTPSSSLESPNTSLETNKKLLLSYSPYGDHQGNVLENQIEDTIGFTGQNYISSAKLIRFPSRFYSSTLGIFLTPDNVEGPNRYTYVSGNPISYSDFTGKEKVKITKYQAMRDFSNMNPRGTFDPVKIDEELMSDDAYKALSIATTLPLAGIFGVELGGAAVTYCLTNPIACHTGAGVVAELALGDALPPGASLSPVGVFDDLAKLARTKPIAVSADVLASDALKGVDSYVLAEGQLLHRLDELLVNKGSKGFVRDINHMDQLAGSAPLANGKYMFSQGTDGRIMLSTRVKGSRGSPHSRLLQGEKAVVAGHLEFRKGILVSVDPFSGHYKPEQWRLASLYKELEKLGLDLHGTGLRDLSQHSDFRKVGKEVIGGGAYTNLVSLLEQNN